MTGRLVLGLDVGGTKLAAGVLDLDAALADPDSVASGEALLAAIVEPSNAAGGPGPMIEHLADLGRRALVRAGASGASGAGAGATGAAAGAAGAAGDATIAIGVACGGPLDPERGLILNPPNLPGWIDVPLAARLEQEFGIPVAIENDANAAALAEWRFGAGRGAADLVYFTISTGIGAGAIAGGRLVRGSSGNALELGHLPVAGGDWPCPCGRRGCLEPFASGTGIARRAREAVTSGRASSLTAIEGGAAAITAAAVLEAVGAGDELAIEVWDATIAALASGVANAVNAFDPALVILGGGVTRAGDALFAPLRRAAAEVVLRRRAMELRIVPAGLGDRVGVVAAASVAIERFGPGDHPRRAAAAADGRRGTAAALREHIEAARALEPLLPQVERVGRIICDAIGAGRKVIAFGNGGSAADAQHLAAELVGHFREDRRALPAMALTTDPSIVTAIGNDFGWDEVFARQVEAHAGPGDVVIGISTSGNAMNVIAGLRAAALHGSTTVALTGGDGGRLVEQAEIALLMPASTTARIQELHTLVVHLVSEQVDAWAAATRGATRTGDER